MLKTFHKLQRIPQTGGKKYKKQKQERLPTIQLVQQNLQNKQVYIVNMWKPLRTFKSCKSYKRYKISCCGEHIGTVASAVLSKNIATMITFPLDTCRIHAQLGKCCQRFEDLYVGFWTVLTTQTVQASFSYTTYFHIINMMTSMYQRPIHEAVVYATCIATIITSFIKVPLVFINRNIVLCPKGNIVDSLYVIFEKLTVQVYKQCWVTIITSEIPETIAKMFINFIVLYYHPNIDNLSRNCIVSMSTSLLTAPLDYIITHSFCKVYQGKFNIRNSFDGIYYRLISIFVGQITFFHTFNTLQPAKFY